ncbi:DUF1640 domain-containing protein [Orrella sp. JC864]|uniref:DUF1640 domain-containing protein n=1 Tax=Orrella sp. JC864 TaxID=3120298 RepID=UPI0012BC6E74
MPTVTFDTLKFVRTLEAGGLPPQQAEAISNAVRDSHDTSELATKADLRSALGELEHRIDARFAAVDARFTLLEQRMTIKLGSMLIVAVGAMAAIAKIL